jgi:serine protease Do
MRRLNACVGAVALGSLGLGFGLGLGLTIGGAPLSRTNAQVAPAATSVVGRPETEAAVSDELARTYEKFAVVDRVFAQASRAVAPSVVHIVARKTAPRGELGEQGRGLIEETGSGVIVRPGPGPGLFVLTNNHVVEGAAAVDVGVTLQDGRVIRPERVWTDPKSDVAVLQLGRDDLPAARLGDSDSVEVGTWVLAIGSPFGLTHSVSHGIISARNRHEQELEDDGVENQDFLQTDAAINPGNSGGPLVNLRGEVIGINTAIASNGGGSEGVGFSIPINLARWIATQLVARGHVSRGALGVNLQDLDAEQASRRGLDRPRGAFVLFVRENTPAARVGLKKGDLVLSYDGVQVNDINHLINLVSRTAIGRVVSVQFDREGRMYAVQVPIADQDEVLRAGASAVVGAGAERKPTAAPSPTQTPNLDRGP